MPALPASVSIRELRLYLRALELQLTFSETLITRIDHLHANYPRGSPSDQFLWSIYNIIDDHIDDLNQK